MEAPIPESRVTSKSACETLVVGDFAGVTADQILKLPVLDAVKAIRAGLPASEFRRAAAVLGLTMDELARKVGASPKAVRRQAAQSGVLSRENSEKLVRTARVRGLARKLFTTDEAAATWIKTATNTLDGDAPIDLLDTDLGAQEVEALLEGLAHGNVL